MTFFCCPWPGHAAYSSSVLGPVAVSGTTRSASVNLGNIQHGDTLYISVQCSNPGGLRSSVTTPGGIRVVTHPPDVTAARLYTVAEAGSGSAVSHFPNRGQHQANNHSVLFGWSGMQDISGIHYSEVTGCTTLLFIQYYSLFMSSTYISIT